jgi:hypothetical protein
MRVSIVARLVALACAAILQVIFSKPSTTIIDRRQEGKKLILTSRESKALQSIAKSGIITRNPKAIAPDFIQAPLMFWIRDPYKGGFCLICCKKAAPA